MIATLLATTLLAPALTLSLKVEGEGYLRFAFDGRIVYGRQATLRPQSGRLTTEWGGATMPLLQVPPGAAGLDVERDGTIVALVGAKREPLGRLSLAVFESGAALKQEGSFWVAKQRPRLMDAGQAPAGHILRLGATPEGVTPGSPAPKADAQFGDLTVTIAPRVELEGKRITLGALGVLDGDAEWVRKASEIDFGLTPRVGFPLKLTRARVLARIKALGLSETAVRLAMGETVEIAAKGQAVTADAIEKAARETLGQAGNDLKLTQPPAPYTAPLGALELRAQPPTYRKDIASVTVEIWVDGVKHDFRTLAFTGSGLQAVVKTNELVKVVFRANGLAIDTVGRAKREGRLGETIEVLIDLGTEKTVHLGTVKGPGLVEVTL